VRLFEQQANSFPMVLEAVLLPGAGAGCRYIDTQSQSVLPCFVPSSRAFSLPFHLIFPLLSFESVLHLSDIGYRAPPRQYHARIMSNPRSSACEWNKHMDSHERPYKCHTSPCDLNKDMDKHKHSYKNQGAGRALNPGFTYSGGLLRHQGEVHKKYTQAWYMYSLT
jgi:hypothetical protein